MGANYIPSIPADVGAEPALGNPASNGLVLASTTAGVRSWVAGGGSVYPRGTSFPSSPAAGDAFYRTDRKVLYVYEGSWQPIESYGAINLYLRSDGNDANDGFANTSGGAKATLAGVWAAIPRLYGGNVTVTVTGTITNSTAGTDLSPAVRLGGKYAAGGAYTIEFVGVDGAEQKSFSSTGTVSETAGNEGLISGLSGMTANAHRGQLLKNVTETGKEWYTVIHENATNSIRAVGSFAVSSWKTRAHAAATNDSWKVLAFGGILQFSGGGFPLSVDVPINFTRIRFDYITNGAIYGMSINATCTQTACAHTTTASKLNYGMRYRMAANCVLSDVYVEPSAFAAVLSQSGLQLWGLGVFGSGTTGGGSGFLCGNASNVTVADVFRVDSSGPAGTGINCISGSSIGTYGSALPKGIWLRNLSVGQSATNFSSILIGDRIALTTGTTTAIATTTGATTDAVITT